MGMMCESHSGQEWPHVIEGEDCAGPGMPWWCSGGMFGEHPPYACDACNTARSYFTSSR